RQRLERFTNRRARDAQRLRHLALRDHRLRLELARQYPASHIGVSARGSRLTVRCLHRRILVEVKLELNTSPLRATPTGVCFDDSAPTKGHTSRPCARATEISSASTKGPPQPRSAPSSDRPRLGSGS